MPKEEFDLDSVTKLYDDTFAHLKELYQHQVASYVIARMLAIASAVITVVGIASYFGIEKAYISMVTDAQNAVQVEMNKAVKSHIENMGTVVDKHMDEMEIAGREAGVTLGIVEGIGKRMEADFDGMKGNFKDMKDEFDDASKSIKKMLSELEAARERFKTLKTNLDNAEELNSLDTRSVQALMERITKARVTLAMYPEDPHENLMLVRSVNQLGIREFKQGDEKTKQQVLDFLTALLERSPGATETGNKQVSLADIPSEVDLYREARTQSIYALRSLASSPPERWYAVEKLKGILADDADKYLQHDAAARSFRVLADEGFLSELLEHGKKGNRHKAKAALKVLVDAAVNDRDMGVQQEAQETLRKIVRTRTFKDFELNPLLGSSLNGELKAYLVCQLLHREVEHRKRATEIAAVFGESRQSFWQTVLIQLVTGDKELQKLITRRASAMRRCAEQLQMTPGEIKKFAKELLKPDAKVQEIAIPALSEIAPVIAVRTFNSLKLKDNLASMVKEIEGRARQELRRKKVASFEAGRWDQTEEALQTLQQILPNNGYLRDLVEIYQITGKYDEATKLTGELRGDEDAKSYLTLYQYFDAVTTLLSGENDQEKRVRLCQAAKAAPVTLWRFSIFQKFIHAYKDKFSSDIDDLVVIAKTGQCVTNSATG